MPIVEANSQDIDDKIPTTLFVPDDDVIIETPSVDPVPVISVVPVVSVVPESTTTSRTTTILVTETTTTMPPVPESVPEVDKGGFVPVRNEEELEVEQVTDAQTEALPEILAVKPVDSLAVDTAPWKPIDAETLVLPPTAANVTDNDDIQGRFIQESSDTGPQSIPNQEKSSTTTSKTVVTESVRPVEIVKQEPEVVPVAEEPEESTDFALMQNLGNMALLVPEDRVRTSSVASPVIPLSSSTEQSSLSSTGKQKTIIPH